MGMSKSSAGRMGGNATKARHGTAHFKRAGKKGGSKGGTSTFKRHGSKYMSVIGRKGGKA